MACPICDQKPINCDCTETERRQFSEIERLRLTDEERKAIEATIFDLKGGANYNEQRSWPMLLKRLRERSATLRGLLERTK